MPGLNRFHHQKDLYSSQAVIGENGGNDSWPINIRIWKYPHEKSWRYGYECKGQLLTADGVAYEPKRGDGEGYASVLEAHAALKESLEQDYV